jgi:hypothetical protein
LETLYFFAMLDKEGLVTLQQPETSTHDVNEDEKER